MIDNSSFFIRQDAGGDARPAVLTTPANGATEIDVIFSRSRADSNFGGTPVENAEISCAVQTNDIANLTIPNKTSTIDISDLLVDENGDIVTAVDDSGNEEAVYASGQEQCKINGKYTDDDGITIFDLTEN